MKIKKTFINKNGRRLKHVILPEEDFELLDRGDYIGYEHLRVRRLSGRKHLESKDRKFLAEYHAANARIQSDPKAVLEQARNSIDEGTTLLLRLVYSRKLRHEFPQEYNANWDEAMNCLTSRLAFLNRQLVRFAEDRVPGPVSISGSTH